ncbi:DUF305 domain-containing protein [Agromyces aurantiacus]|uniref:DUF305 domain-containing protein n=1 Tax=Agromyces aurantiacus TaxID=165814 RepID=A0ABV9R5G1_9MICO|nr:DUF305 domain-containing protein [Agromyces aurantiacus]MBM7503474.1 uncharacterized protein (DUF305 family) [Agromyces aurantiacus]
MTRPARWAIVLAAGVALLAVGAIAFSIGRLSTLGDPTPTDASVEAGFARDMQVHHHQGVELAMIVRDATDDPDVRLLAYDIATTQAQQAGQMYGWLAEWGLPQFGSEPSMAWMTGPAEGGGGHDGHGAGVGEADASGHAPGEPMPGLATPAQVEELRSLDGVEAERRFLELMIAHHAGAVEMAEAALDRSDYPVVVSLAESIVSSQQSEIALMEDMLAERS